jgi:hypothetical protein
MSSGTVFNALVMSAKVFGGSAQVFYLELVLFPRLCCGIASAGSFMKEVSCRPQRLLLKLGHSLQHRVRWVVPLESGAVM